MSFYCSLFLGGSLSQSSSSASRLHEVRFVLWAVLVLNLLVALAKLGYGVLDLPPLNHS